MRRMGTIIALKINRKAVKFSLWADGFAASYIIECYEPKIQDL